MGARLGPLVPIVIWLLSTERSTPLFAALCLLSTVCVCPCQACQRALERNAFRLKADLARVLRSKYTPNLEFRHDHLPPLQAAAAEAFEAVERELTAQAAAAAVGPGSAQDDSGAESLGSRSTTRQHKGPEFDSGSADGASISEGGYAQQDIEAAIQRLEAATRTRPPGY